MQIGRKKFSDVGICNRVQESVGCFVPLFGIRNDEATPRFIDLVALS